MLWNIGLFDPPINVWTAWLMITRNRQYLRRVNRQVLCCIDSQTESVSRTNTEVLMDVVSKSKSTRSRVDTMAVYEAQGPNLCDTS